MTCLWTQHIDLPTRSGMLAHCRKLPRILSGFTDSLPACICTPNKIYSIFWLKSIKTVSWNTLEKTKFLGFLCFLWSDYEKVKLMIMRYPCLVMITGCKEIWITLFCCLVYIDPLLNIYLSLTRFVTMLRILIVWKEVHIDNIYLSSLPRCLNEKVP